MKLIKVKYEILDAVLDFRTAKDHATLVHPEEDWFPPCQVGGDPKRNLVASADGNHGDVEGIMAHRFHYDVVYTNHQAAGAYRGYGAIQGIFAVVSPSTPHWQPFIPRAVLSRVSAIR